eukprot:m.62359 g.62359  ORF g.62359 m.62359 type:complete len:775 (-) comp13333_c0_seq1:46-2370(-)
MSSEDSDGAGGAAVARRRRTQPAPPGTARSVPHSASVPATMTATAAMATPSTALPPSQPEASPETASPVGPCFASLSSDASTELAECKENLKQACEYGKLLLTQLEACRADRDQISAAYENQKTDLQSLQGKVEQLERNNRRLKAQNEVLARESTDTLAQQAEADTCVRLQSTKAAQGQQRDADRLRELQHHVAETEQAITKLRADASRHDAERKKNLAEIRRLTVRADVLETERDHAVEEHHTATERAAARIKALEATVRRSAAETEELRVAQRAAAEEYETQIEDLKHLHFTELSDTKRFLAQSRHQCDALRREVEDLHDQAHHQAAVASPRGHDSVLEQSSQLSSLSLSSSLLRDSGPLAASLGDELSAADSGVSWNSGDDLSDDGDDNDSGNASTIEGTKTAGTRARNKLGRSATVGLSELKKTLQQRVQELETTQAQLADAETRLARETDRANTLAAELERLRGDKETWASREASLTANVTELQQALVKLAQGHQQHRGKGGENQAGEAEEADGAEEQDEEGLGSNHCDKEAAAELQRELEGERASKATLLLEMERQRVALAKAKKDADRRVAAATQASATLRQQVDDALARAADTERQLQALLVLQKSQPETKTSSSPSSPMSSSPGDDDGLSTLSKRKGITKALHDMRTTCTDLFDLVEDMTPGGSVPNFRRKAPEVSESTSEWCETHLQGVTKMGSHLKVLARRLKGARAAMDRLSASKYAGDALSAKQAEDITRLIQEKLELRKIVDLWECRFEDISVNLPDSRV